MKKANHAPAPLIHVGYHKTGSTWLQTHMFGNPATGFVQPLDRKSTVDEWLVQPHALDFDAQQTRRALRPAIEAALKSSKVPVITSERLSGVPNWGGYDSADLANRLHSVFPDGRILIIIREQVGMILSVYNQYVRGGGGCSLRYFLNIAEGPGGYPTFRFEHFQYHRLILHYQALFGERNVLVLPYEMLLSEPDLFTRRIESFSGCKSIYSYTHSVKTNASVGPFALILLRIAGPFLHRTVDNGFSYLQVPFSKYVEFFHKKYLIPYLFKPAGDAVFRKGLSNSWRRIVEASIDGKFEESNRITSNIIGVDLSDYGYKLSADTSLEAPSNKKSELTA